MRLVTLACCAALHDRRRWNTRTLWSPSCRHSTRRPVHLPVANNGQCGQSRRMKRKRDSRHTVRPPASMDSAPVSNCDFQSGTSRARANVYPGDSIRAEDEEERHVDHLTRTP
eukprot:702580-Prymnesium_polylepis.3